jgi:hypothetical protein
MHDCHWITASFTISKGCPACVCCRCHNLETPRSAPPVGQCNSSTHSGKSCTQPAAKAGASTPSRAAQDKGKVLQGQQSAHGQRDHSTDSTPSLNRCTVEAAASTANPGTTQPDAQKTGGLMAWLAARRERIRQARAARGVNLDLEAAASLAIGEPSDADGESAFRIWSLPSESAITTDPYCKTSKILERNESRPPGRPS